MHAGNFCLGGDTKVIQNKTFLKCIKNEFKFEMA